MYDQFGEQATIINYKLHSHIIGSPVDSHYKGHLVHSV